MLTNTNDDCRLSCPAGRTEVDDFSSSFQKGNTNIRNLEIFHKVSSFISLIFILHSLLDETGDLTIEIISGCCV